MNIYLGDLSIKDIERLAGIEFPQELIDYMKPRYQPEASDVKPGKWHCFHIPFVLECGDMETAKEIYKHLKPFNSQFKQRMEISVREEAQ